MDPLVSVVMSTYNRAHIVAIAVQSVLAQSLRDFELIVVDDGSTDNTCEVISGLKDERICYVYQPNAGLAAGRNAGIAQAKGKYVAFIDDDDFLTPDSLAQRVEFLQNNPHVGWVSGGHALVNETGGLLGYSRPWLNNLDLTPKMWLYWCPTCPSAVMVQRDWLNQVDGFDSQQGLQEDWDLWLRLAFAGCPMAWIPQVVCHYQVHTANMTRSSEAIHATNGLLRVLEKLYSQDNLQTEILALRDSAYAHSYLKLASAAFASHDIGTAMHDIERAMLLDPKMQINHGEVILDFLVAYARSPLIEHPLGHARFILDNLPEELFMIRQRKKKALGTVAAGLYFAASEVEDWNRVRSVFPVMITHDPSWLTNLGVWSILRRAMRCSLGPLR